LPTDGTSFVPGTSCEINAQTPEVVQTWDGTQSLLFWHWPRHISSCAQMSGAMHGLWESQRDSAGSWQTSTALASPTTVLDFTQSWPFGQSPVATQAL